MVNGLNGLKMEINTWMNEWMKYSKETLSPRKWKENFN